VLYALLRHFFFFGFKNSPWNFGMDFKGPELLACAEIFDRTFDPPTQLEELRQKMMPLGVVCS
jgi:hypothetical protein